MMDSRDQKWLIFTEALHEGDYRSAWLLADRGEDGVLSQMESVILHTALRSNQVPQALAAWEFTYQGDDAEKTLDHIQRMIRVKTPRIDPTLEDSINKSLDQIYASVTDILHF
jgi:hypothetical protein